jgi:hypothetical protein
METMFAKRAYHLTLTMQLREYMIHLRKILQNTAPPYIGPAVNAQQAVPIIIEAELESYKMSPTLPMRDIHGGWCNPLRDWWLPNAIRFPHIAIIARKVLAVPATSAPVERLFSSAGLTIANDRANLLPEIANDLVFLHDALPFFGNDNIL